MSFFYRLMTNDISIDLIIDLIGICGFLLVILNTIWDKKRQNKYEKIIYKIPAKKRVINKWYNLAKDLFDRIEFTDIESGKDKTSYYYKVKRKDGEGYEEISRIETLIYEIELQHRDFKGICGYSRNEIEDHEIGLYKRIRIMSVHNKFVVPNDKLPQEPKILLEDELNYIILSGKENGIKKKYIKFSL